MEAIAKRNLPRAQKAVWSQTKSVTSSRKSAGYLAYSPKAAAGLIKKVLESAIANASTTKVRTSMS